MKSHLGVLAMVILAVHLGAEFSGAADELSIREIEGRAHRPRKGEDATPLVRVVLASKATKEEKQELLDLYKALAKTKPSRGSQEAWEKTTAAMIAAAEEIVRGDAKNTDKLRAAANCKACHDAHKGPDPALAADGTLVEKPGDFGLAAPPQFVKLANISKEKVSISVYSYESVPVTSLKEEEIEQDGVRKKVQVPVTEMRHALRQSQISLAYVRLFDSTGKEIKGDDVWNRLKPGVVLLRQTDAKQVNPAFLKLLSPDALILAPTVVELPPAGK